MLMHRIQNVDHKLCPATNFTFHHLYAVYFSHFWMGTGLVITVVLTDRHTNGQTSHTDLNFLSRKAWHAFLESSVYCHKVRERCVFILGLFEDEITTEF